MAVSEPCARPKPAFVYMVRCTGGTLYTGWTTDPAARLRAHQSGRGAKYTRARGTGGFAYLELCADKRAALRREYALKQLPKAQKELLCAAWMHASHIRFRTQCVYYSPISYLSQGSQAKRDKNSRRSYYFLRASGHFVPGRLRS